MREDRGGEGARRKNSKKCGGEDDDDEDEPDKDDESESEAEAEAEDGDDDDDEGAFGAPLPLSTPLLLLAVSGSIVSQPPSRTPFAARRSASVAGPQRLSPSPSATAATAVRAAQ